MKSIFEKHHMGRPFIKKNYKDVLKQMETKGAINCEPAVGDRKKNTFADPVVVTFP
jgi:hypothetical protein